MRQFFFKLTSYFLILCLAVVCFYLINRSYLQKADRLKLKNSPRTLFLGHSHAECAFNDSIIVNSKNLGFSAESYFYTYQKLRPLLDNNDISTIFIEASNWQFSASMDSTIWKDYYLSRNCKNYQAFMGLEESKFLLKKNPRKFISIQPLVLKQQLQTLITPPSKFFEIMDWGGYVGLTRSVVDSILGSFGKPGAIRRNISSKISTINLQYLDKILELCQEKKVKVFLIRAPMHSESTELTNEPELKAVLKERYKVYPFLDFRDFPLSNEEFADLEHLNAKGATRFSEYLNKAILNNQFDRLSQEKQLGILQK